MQNATKRKITVVILEIVLAIIFVLLANIENTAFKIFYQSYFADIVIPFGYYFLLSLVQIKHPAFEKWWIKALSVFVLCSISEIMQFFGIFALARVFDPIDIAAYGIGVLLATLVDKTIFLKRFSYWE